ncbi:MAG: hypothetical protein ACOC8B_07260, partial [Gemmatimonadota bacterium]
MERLKTTRSPALTLLVLAVAWSAAACGAGDADAAADRTAVAAGPLGVHRAQGEQRRLGKGAGVQPVGVAVPAAAPPA